MPKIIVSCAWRIVLDVTRAHAWYTSTAPPPRTRHSARAQTLMQDPFYAGTNISHATVLAEAESSEQRMPNDRSTLWNFWQRKMNPTTFPSTPESSCILSCKNEQIVFQTLASSVLFCSQFFAHIFVKKVRYHPSHPKAKKFVHAALHHPSHGCL